ncbi:cytochrome b-c1 complex subunit 6, mitochondrial-like [Pieris brassicae]|uniref:Ubiquinol-cytochrome C reductase hinge domain-containing protein n=1 Tax=Pieris brassicae TaxID=7116 RepID=A0A9P0TPI8_PIEBR|nr:cytochrome b-c1 complex subunit 6, mitochondrial-like [Pieris brassicae]CAH4035287.1 unnamed protein product [Pieris brassicae]
MPDYDPTSDDQLTKERGMCVEGDHHVKKAVEILEKCENRVKSKAYTAETCHQEAMDFMEALDHCVGEKAFKRLV